MRRRPLTWLAPPPLADPLASRQAALLHALLLGVLVVLGLAIGLNVVVFGAAALTPAGLGPNLAALIGVAVGLALLRRGQLRAAVGLVAAIALLGEAHQILAGGLPGREGTLIVLVIPIALAGLLIGRRALWLAVSLSVAIVVLAAIAAPAAPASPEPPLATATLFVLVAGLLGLVLDRSGGALRAALAAALDRERDLAREVAERARAEAAVRFLADAGQRLTASLDVEATLAAAADLAALTLADWCVAYLVTDDGPPTRAAIAHRDAATAARVRATLGPAPAALAPGDPVAEALRTGHTILLAEVAPDVLAAAARDPAHLALLRSLGVRAQVVVPLVARGRTLGALSLLMAELGRRFGPADLPVVEELARRAALALENARLYEAERAAAGRAAALQEVTAALAGALTAERVVDVVIARGLAVCRADAGALYGLEGDAFALLGYAGYPVAAEAAHARFPADRPGPLGDALRARSLVVVETPAEFVARWPHLAALVERSGDAAAAAVPLLLDERLLGVLYIVNRSPRRFTVDDRSFLAALAGQCAQALERARLHDASERERRRQAVLAEASAALATSLDQETTLERVARLIVPTLADFCFVDLLGDDGHTRRVAAVHADPARADLERLALSYRADPSAPHGVARVLRTGQTEYIARVPPGMIEAIAGDDPDRLALLRALDVRSILVVPLAARGQTLGALSLAMTDPARRHTPDDRALAEALAGRAALAIDNARLYAEARAAIRRRDEFLSVAAHELKTPVAGLKGYAQLLQRAEGRGQLDAERLRRGLATIVGSADRLTALTEDLLDVARIRLGHLALRPEPLDLAALVRATAEHVGEGLAGGHRLDLHAEAGAARVVGDPSRLEQVLLNLLDNAAKYSPSGGTIAVGLRPADTGVLLTVADEGIGLPPGAEETIFEPFGRAENAMRGHVPGMGLGLHICRSIVERHGGWIRATSAGEGRGTTLTVWLPAAGGHPIAPG